MSAKFVQVAPPVLRKEKASSKQKVDPQKQVSLNPYVQFLRDKVPEILSSEITKAQAFEIAKKRWIALSDNDKKPYRDQSMKDSEKFYQRNKIDEEQESPITQIEHKTKKQLAVQAQAQKVAIPQKQVLSVTDEKVPKPQKALTATNAFIQQKAPVMMKSESISFKEASKKLELVWNDLDEEDQQPYNKIAELDKIRYQNDLQNAKARPKNTGAPESAPAVVEPLKPMKPKKAKVAFMFYVSAESAKLVKEKGLSSAAGAIKILGANWQKFTELDKKPYMDLREADIVRHQKQMDEFNSKGYFTTEDGIKSTELKQKKKKIKRGKRIAVQPNNDEPNEDEPKIEKKQRIE